MTNLRLAAVVLFGLAFVACSEGPSGDGNITDPSRATIQANPNPLVFRDVAVGDSGSGTVRVFNSDLGPLKITSIELLEDTADDEGGSVEFQRVDWPESAELGEDEFIDLTVMYSPLDRSPDQGRIVIRSNDPLNGDFTIPILAKDSAPKLDSASPIVFQGVTPVTPETRNTVWQLSEVKNTGDAVLKITEIAVTGSLDFSVSYPESLDDADPLTDNQTSPAVLEPGQTFPIRVYFNPLDARPAAAELVITSNDPDSLQFAVELQGNRGEPCLKLSQEDEISFGAGEIGFANPKAITIENCSAGQDLEVSIAVTDEDGVFGIDALSAGATVIPAGETQNAVLTFTPTAAVISTGELTVQSNDPTRPILKVALTGRGEMNLCPQAIAVGSLSDSPQQRRYISTAPLKTVLLDGMASTDANGVIASFEWTIVQRPAGSIARLEPSNMDPNPSLFVDMAGVYIVELTVYDAQGRANCGPDATSRVMISAIPDRDVHIELFWDTPRDLNQTDTVGTDLDLHYMHPDGRWNNAPYDVFWRNATADWGEPGDQDDPLLDVDDTDGLGPEVINHDGPESGLTYEVGVYYYADKGLGPSYATLRIYVDGVQTYEHLAEPLSGKETFWRVASISWPGGVVQPIDEISNGFPSQ